MDFDDTDGGEVARLVQTIERLEADRADLKELVDRQQRRLDRGDESKPGGGWSEADLTRILIDSYSLNIQAVTNFPAGDLASEYWKQLLGIAVSLYRLKVPDATWQEAVHDFTQQLFENQ